MVGMVGQSEGAARAAFQDVKTRCALETAAALLPHPALWRVGGDPDASFWPIPAHPRQGNLRASFLAAPSGREPRRPNLRTRKRCLADALAMGAPDPATRRLALAAVGFDSAAGADEWSGRPGRVRWEVEGALLLAASRLAGGPRSVPHGLRVAAALLRQRGLKNPFERYCQALASFGSKAEVRGWRAASPALDYALRLSASTREASFRSLRAGDSARLADDIDRERFRIEAGALDAPDAIPWDCEVPAMAEFDAAALRRALGLPADAESASVTLDGRDMVVRVRAGDRLDVEAAGQGTLYVIGPGGGDARHVGPGAGNAVRGGSGPGRAFREGPGGGMPVRRPSGDALAPWQRPAAPRAGLGPGPA